MAQASTAAGGAGSDSYGGFWIRVLAYSADISIIMIALVLLAVPLYFLGGAGVAVYTVLAAVGPFAYFVWFTASPRQATFGKQLCGLRVEHVGSGQRISLLRSVGRELAKIVSAAILMIGYLMVGFTGRKQGLHDVMAATVVVREGPARILLALFVALLSVLIPIIAVLAFGAFFAGLMAVFMGGMMGGDAMKMKPVPQESRPVQQPKPKPAATKVEAPAPTVAATPAPAAAPAAETKPAAAASAAAAPAGGASRFVGAWTNEDKQTRGITRVAIASEGDKLKVHMWGSCTPKECDWGEVAVPAKDAEGGALSVTWSTSFKVDKQQLALLPDGVLQVTGNAQFIDNSGRPARGYTERFVRPGAAQAKPETAKPEAPKPEAPKPVAAAKPEPVAPAAAAAPAAPAPRPKAVETIVMPAYRPGVEGPKYNDLMTAVLYRDPVAVADLLKLGKWVDKRDPSGLTPLMVAAQIGDVPTAEALLQGGADPTLSGPRGVSAASIAREKRNAAMLALLQKHGQR
jgi:uncharacterized RDD family membrane protein YckC